MTRSGKLWEQTKWELGTEECEFGLLPTLDANMGKRGNCAKSKYKNGVHQVTLNDWCIHEAGQKLQPEFCEILMGFPIGWTDLTDLKD
jgi:hypothetical protein